MEYVMHLRSVPIVMTLLCGAFVGSGPRDGDVGPSAPERQTRESGIDLLAARVPAAPPGEQLPAPPREGPPPDAPPEVPVLPEPTAGPMTPIRVDFANDVRPILEARCRPCHFEGGTVYAGMPFDKPETIHRLGTKLFTRIQAENERRLIRTFLAQPLPSPSP